MPDTATAILPLKPRSAATSRMGSVGEAAGGDLFLGLLLSLQVAPGTAVPAIPPAVDRGTPGLIPPDRLAATTLDLTVDQVSGGGGKGALPIGGTSAAPVGGTSALPASGPEPDGRAETPLADAAMLASDAGEHANPLRAELPPGAPAVVEPNLPPPQAAVGGAPHRPVRLGSRGDASPAGLTPRPTTASDGQWPGRSRVQVPDHASTSREWHDQVAAAAAISPDAPDAPAPMVPDAPQDTVAGNGHQAPPLAPPPLAAPGLAAAPAVARPDPAPVVSTASIMPTTPMVRTLKLATDAKGADVKGVGAVLRLRVSDCAAQRVSIEIEPADLGPVAVSFEIDKSGHAKATFTAERVDTLHLLRRDAQALTDLLNASGVAVGQGDLGFNLGHRSQGQGMGQRGVPATEEPRDGVGHGPASSIQPQLAWTQPRGLLDLEV